MAVIIDSRGWVQSESVKVSSAHSGERTDDCVPSSHTLGRFQIGAELCCVDPGGWRRWKYSVRPPEGHSGWASGIGKEKQNFLLGVLVTPYVPRTEDTALQVQDGRGR